MRTDWADNLVFSAQRAHRPAILDASAPWSPPGAVGSDFRAPVADTEPTGTFTNASFPRLLHG